MAVEQELVETVEFWRRRIFEGIAVGRELHQLIWYTDINTWKESQDYSTGVLDHVLPDQSSVLDVGCGYGALIECLPKREITYTGIDVSPDLLEIAGYRYPDYKHKFIQSDARSTKFADGQFDWAVCRSIRKMIQNKSDNWREIETEVKRVARNVLVIEYENPRTWSIL